ncbi:MAG: AAA family ATPase [Herpetosiphonaceae bacterium]|nr:AAA family ATPase [Herpetosiphonaceae bacterium]
MDLPAVIQALLQPDLYPHPVQPPFSVLQTHAAYVVLTGEYAYKVKKSVNLGFLDFSSLEKRRFFCHEELRLNARHAPDLYLAVVPIAAPNGAFQLGAGAGEIVEYALQMRQFPQSALLSALFARGELTLEHMALLGRRVAAMHALAPTNAEIQAFGALSAIEQVIADNYRSGQAYIGRDQTQQQYDQTKAFTDALLQAHPDWFAQRQAAGMIRECHGDLHLNNVYYHAGEMHPFDCIEFNPAFRNIDVLYDVAFMLMDLDGRGRRDLAYQFLNSYLEQTADYWGAVLLPLYASMRAYVRAKVQSLLGDDPHLSPSDRSHIHQEAARYYQHAWDYTRRQDGRIIVMMGLSGSGKSTVGQHLAQQLGAVHIRADALRKHLGGVPLAERGAADLYTRAMSDRTYARLLELGIFLARHGQRVILDAKYDRRQRRQTVLEQAQAAGLPIQLVYCTAPQSILHQRLEQRQHDVSDATVEVLAGQVFEPLSVAEEQLTLTVNTAAAWREELDLEVGG